MEASTDTNRWLKEEITKLKPSIENPDLPRGIVHGDIFADNAMFEGEKLVAIIDFEVYNHKISI